MKTRSTEEGRVLSKQKIHSLLVFANHAEYINRTMWCIAMIVMYAFVGTTITALGPGNAWVKEIFVGFKPLFSSHSYI